MIDLPALFQDGPPEKGSFLSRIFGIFNEEIVRIWARDSRSPYNIFERRPTLFGGSRNYTLDFLFEKDGALFVSEMKCEIQYHNYRYWRLESPAQLKHHVVVKCFWPPSFEHSSSSFLPNSAVSHRYACAAGGCCSNRSYNQ